MLDELYDAVQARLLTMEIEELRQLGKHIGLLDVDLTGTRRTISTTIRKKIDADLDGREETEDEAEAEKAEEIYLRDILATSPTPPKTKTTVRLPITFCFGRGLGDAPKIIWKIEIMWL